jgi:hypothetical protein
VSSALSILEFADLIGRYRYVELLAFETLGGRAPFCESPQGCCFLSAASRAHAYRAQLFEELLPVSVGLLDAATCTKTPDPAIDEAFLYWGEATFDAFLIDGLISVIYPSALFAYEAHHQQCTGPQDRALRRALRRAIDDLRSVRDEGVHLGASSGERSPDFAHRIESLIKGAGGLFGPIPLLT